jgi:hypothetical protein
MPASPDGDYIQPSWGEIKAGPTDHIEDRYSAVARNGSRDRDVEENGFDAIDYGDPQREASDAHILRPQPNWLGRRSSEETSDADVEYAMAVREMTNDSMETQRKRAIERGTGR